MQPSHPSKKLPNTQGTAVLTSLSPSFPTSLRLEVGHQGLPIKRKEDATSTSQAPTVSSEAQLQIMIHLRPFGKNAYHIGCS